MDYTRTELPNNVVKIQYYTMPGKHLHWFGILAFGLPNLGIAIADGLIAANPNYKIFYFDQNSGKQIDEKELEQRRLNK